MTITLKYGDGTVYTWIFPAAIDVNKLLAGLVENARPEWTSIEIIIHTLKLGEAG